jgi:hypothetical protein
LEEDLSDGLVYKHLLEKLSGTPITMPTGELVQVLVRVTRFGEFSPIDQFFHFWHFLRIISVA